MSICILTLRLYDNSQCRTTHFTLSHIYQAVPRVATVSNRETLQIKPYGAVAMCRSVDMGTYCDVAYLSWRLMCSVRVSG